MNAKEFILSVLNIFKEAFRESASIVMLVTYGFLAVAAVGFRTYGESSTSTFLLCILGIMIMINLAFGFTSLMGPKVNMKRYPFLSEYDCKLIEDSFNYGRKKKFFFLALGAMFEHNDCQSADQCFQKLSEMKLNDRENGILSFYRSICSNRLGFYTHSARYAAQAAEKRIGIPESYLLAARSYANAAQYEEAEIWYRKTYDHSVRNYTFPFIFNEFGNMYLKAQKPELAEEQFRTSIDNGLYPAESMGGLARCCIMQKRDQEALGWFRCALINQIPDPDGFFRQCETACIAAGLDKDHFINAARFNAPNV